MAVDIGPIENFNVSDPELYRADAWRPYFERMRNEAPVHYCADRAHGPYWSISTYDLIMQVELDFKTFSNRAKFGGIQLQDIAQNLNRPSFVSMDLPEHTERRRSVTAVTPAIKLAGDGRSDPSAHRSGCGGAAPGRYVRLGRKSCHKSDRHDAVYHV